MSDSSTAVSSSSSSTLPIPIKYTQLFINNEFCSGTLNRTFPSINPATEQVLADVSEASVEDVDKAVQAAHNAFRSTTPGSWRKLEAYERGAYLTKLADLIDRDKEYVANLEALDNGKPVFMAKVVDAATAVRMLRYYAGWCDKITGSTLPTVGGGLTYTRYEPLGVIAAILPFNFPMLGAVTKAAPALAAGNTIVIKPAEQTPLGALYLASLVKEAGFPPGTFNVVNGPGEITGAALVKHPLVRKITFTGSTPVGKIIQKEATNTLKRVTLELGGKNPCIVLPDADLDTAVKIASGGNYFNSGQICVGISRVFVHESIYDQFIERAVERASKRTIGDQYSECDQGPQASLEQFERVLYYIQKGKDEGAKCVYGGERWANAPNGKGYYIVPTIFANVTDNMTIAKEEIFGPVMCVLKYSTIEEVSIESKIFGTMTIKEKRENLSTLSITNYFGIYGLIIGFFSYYLSIYGLGYPSSE